MPSYCPLARDRQARQGLHNHYMADQSPWLWGTGVSSALSNHVVLTACRPKFFEVGQELEPVQTET